MSTTTTSAAPPVVAGHSHDADTSAATRATAIRSFSIADFPVLTGREEQWRFTPLRRLRALLGGGASGAEVSELAGPAPQCHHAELPAGVTVSSVAKGAGRDGSQWAPFDRPSALAYSAAASTRLVEVAANAVVEEPVVLSLQGQGAHDAAADHTVISIGGSASVTVVLDQVGGVTLADNVEIVVGENASLKLVSIADWSGDSVQLQHQSATLARDARLTHIAVSLGGSVVRQYTSVAFAGPGAEVDAYGIYFADAGQHLEHRLLMDHAVSDCRSNVNYRGALQGADAHTVWVGDVLIRAAATGTDTYEMNRNLVLTDGARADSVPNLEIETGEIVGAGHASATGRFDDEQLFYLQARGIPADEARRLVVRGFFAELISKIGIAPVQERLLAAIEERLAKAGA